MFAIDSLLLSFVEWSYLNTDMSTSLKHRKKMKAEPSRLIPRKLIENLLELSIVIKS